MSMSTPDMGHRNSPRHPAHTQLVDRQSSSSDIPDTASAPDIDTQHKQDKQDMQDMTMLAASIPLPSSSATLAAFRLSALQSRRQSSSNAVQQQQYRPHLPHLHSHPAVRRTSSPHPFSLSFSSEQSSRRAGVSPTSTSSTAGYTTRSSIASTSTELTSPSLSLLSSPSPYTCKRTDSGCFSDVSLSTVTSTASLSSSSEEPVSSAASETVDFSRATSCAHPECVMATPCEKMIALSGITSWPVAPRRGRQLTRSTDEDSSSSPSSPPQRGPPHLMVLDNACGASALVTMQLIGALPSGLMQDAQLIATDLSSRVVSQATRRIAESDWADHCFTFKMDQQHMLGLRDAFLTHVFTSFGIHLAKDVEATLKEMKRVLVPGGICAFTVWKHLPWLDILAKAIKTEYPKRPMAFPYHDDALMSLTRWNPWHDAEWIKRQIANVGFLDTTTARTAKDDEKSERTSATREARQSDDKSTTKEEVPHHEDDWSQYEFHSGGETSRSPSRETHVNKATAPRRPPLRRLSTPPPPTGSPLSSCLSPFTPITPLADPLADVEPDATSTHGYIKIEEVVSTHRYTKHEFMSNFGTSVLDHLLAASWGKERIFTKGGETRRDLREALERYLAKVYPDDMDEIELTLTALVVVVKKGDKMDLPSEM